MAIYCDVCLPVPLDQPFTYSLIGDARFTAQVGCRVLVPFQQRKLSGTILRLHDSTPDYKVRPIEKLLEIEPIFDEKLIALGIWVARYYLAPVGEVFRIMAPLGGEIKRNKIFSLTDAGRDLARQSLLGIVDATDPAARSACLPSPAPRRTPPGWVRRAGEECQSECSESGAPRPGEVDAKDECDSNGCRPATPCLESIPAGSIRCDGEGNCLW
jgi:primosomal protein N'